MSGIDWAVLLGTLGLIVGYGTYMTRKSESLEGYLKGGSDMKWLTIGLSVMATQASAITFISTPGVAYESGMEFVQNYFGLPFAIIIVCVVFIPIYYRLKVYTAYEYLEQRFDIRIRLNYCFPLHAFERSCGRNNYLCSCNNHKCNVGVVPTVHNFTSWDFGYHLHRFGRNKSGKLDSKMAK